MYDWGAVARVYPNVWERRLRAVAGTLLVPCLFWPNAVMAQASCQERADVKKLIQQGNNPALSYKRQEAAFLGAIRFCPNDPQIYRALSVLLIKDGAIDAALSWIDRGLRLAPADPGLRFSQGVALLSSGRAAEALDVLKQLNPDAKTEFYIGMAQRKLGAHEAARQALMQAFESGYQDPYLLYVVIEQDRALGQKKIGLEHFQILDQRFPNSPFLHLLLGDAHLEQHQDTEAEREYREALKQDPSLPLVHSKLGFLEFTRARYAEAADFFQQDIAVNPDFAESYLYLGLCLRRLGKNVEAIRAFEHAIARDANSLNAYRQLSAALIQEGKLPEALRVLNKGVKRFPNDEALQAQLARALTRSGRADQGGKAAERARQLMEQNANAQPSPQGEPASPMAEGAASTVADTTRREGRSPSTPGEAATRGDQGSSIAERGSRTPLLGQARKCLETADAECANGALPEVSNQQVRRSPESFETEAQVLQQRQKYTEALAAIKRAIEADPNQSRFLVTQGELYQKVGDQTSAIRSFLEAEKLGDHSPIPVYSIGMSFFALGYHDDLKDYYDRASRHFNIALKLDPHFSKAEFMLGVIDAVQAGLPEAKRHFEKALELDADNAYYHLHYGVLLNRLGDSDQALRQLQEANKLLPSCAPVHLNLGKMYARLGRYAEARSELEVAVKINPNLAEAFYTLGGVYRDLGLDTMSKNAFDSFKTARQRKNESDPLEAISGAESPAGGQNP